MLPTLWKSKGSSLTTRPIGDFRHQMDDLLNRFFGRLLLLTNGDYEAMRTWDFDVDDKDNEIVVKAEVPGFEGYDIDAQLNNGFLTIQTEKKRRKDEDECYRSYRQSFTIPCDYHADKTTATCRNGVLELHFPKTEWSEARHIPIPAK